MNRQATGTASSSTLPRQRLRKSPASNPATSPLIKIKASNWEPTINAANNVVATQHRNTLNSSTLLSFYFKQWESVTQAVAQQVSLHRSYCTDKNRSDSRSGCTAEVHPDSIVKYRELSGNNRWY